MTREALPARLRRRSSLSHRLFLAFLVVSLGSLATVGAVGVYGGAGRLSTLTSDERQQTAAGVAEATARAYRATGRLAGADLSDPERIAWTVGARATFLDAGGRFVGGTDPANRYLSGSPTVTAPVVVDGTRVGTVRVWFSGDAWTVRQARTLLWHWALLALAASAVLAAAASFAVSRHIVRPLRRLTEAAERFRRGDRTARAGHHDEPGEIGSLAAALDESADAVVAEDAARRRMTADIAHEIRTPLAALQAGLEEVRAGYVDPTSEYLADLHDQTLRLNRVVGDLAALASAESAGRSLRPAVLDLADVARDEVAEKHALLRAGGLTVDTDLAPADAVGDAGRLGEVVGNLLVNAARYCRAGDRVRVSTGTRGSTTFLTVTDTGPGIAVDDLPHVFDRLYRGANASGVAGSGIGLAIVRELVQAHGGTVSVAAPPAGGTTVSVSLPRADRPPCEEPPRGVTPGRGPASRRPPA